MKTVTVFADAFYWIALLNPRDDWHSEVKSFSRSLKNAKLVTTEEVLTEVLTNFSVYGSHMRHKAAQLIERIFEDPMVEVVLQSHDSFSTGLELYNNRLDKEYSLQDCISMQHMKKRSITEVLTHDKHFLQEGFNVLFK